MKALQGWKHSKDQLPGCSLHQHCVPELLACLADVGTMHMGSGLVLAKFLGLGQP